MAALSTIVARQPQIYQTRFSSQWIAWCNSLLAELAAEQLLPSSMVESGVTVDDYVWITRPTGLRTVKKIWNPQNSGQDYSWEEVNGKIKLIGAEVEEETTPDAATAFTEYAATSIKVNVTGAADGQYANYLLVITAGTWAGKTMVIDDSDATSGGYTKLYFKHSFSSALDAAKITAANIVHPDYYVMMKYVQSFTAISALGDEVPVDDDFESPVVDAYLTYRAVRESSPPVSEPAMQAKADYVEALRKLKIERRVPGGKIQPRWAPGMNQYQNKDMDMEISYKEDLRVNV